MTGLAQVSGRNDLVLGGASSRSTSSTSTSRSLRLDLKILAGTLARVVRREGITDAGGVTMTEFRGSNGSQS